MKLKESYGRRDWQKSNFSQNGLDPPLTSESKGYLTWRNFRQAGDNFPNWRKSIMSGADTTTTMSGVKYRCELSPGVIEWHGRDLQNEALPPSFNPTYPRVNRTIGQLIVPAVPVTGSTSQVAINQAIKNFIAKARSAQRELQGGVLLGELGQTVRFLKDSAKGLRNLTQGHLTSLSKAKRGFKGASGKAKRKYLANKWLEFQYAAKPLYNDIQDAAHAAARIALDDYPPHKRVSAFGTYTSQTVTEEQIIVGTFNTYFNWVTKVRSECRFYGSVRLTSAAAGKFSPNMEILGLTAKDFLPTVWELIPYSFLIDYFTNIGDLVSAVSFSSSNFAWKARGTKDVASVENTGPYKTSFYVQGPFGATSWNDASLSLGSALYERTDISRNSHTGYLIPTLEFSLPGSSSLKWANVGALLYQHNRIIPF
jgi:hypothetical protein